jgi:hypothetical protein
MKESVKLIIGQLRAFKMKNRKKTVKKKKRTESKRPVGHNQVYQYMHNWSSRKKGNIGNERKTILRIMAKNIPNLMEDLNNYIHKHIKSLYP